MHHHGSGTAGSGYQATTRIEFVSVDLNNDGDSTDPDEGFMRVFQSTDPRYVVAGNFGRRLRRCAERRRTRTAAARFHRGATFTFVRDIAGCATLPATLGGGQGHCYLGGDEHLDSSPAIRRVRRDRVAGRRTWLPSPMPYDPRLGQAAPNGGLALSLAGHPRRERQLSRASSSLTVRSRSAGSFAAD